VPFNLGRFVELRAAGAVQRPSLLDRVLGRDPERRIVGTVRERERTTPPRGQIHLSPDTLLVMFLTK
jgi:hypothetical protein